MPDFGALAALARRYDLPLIVDNTFGAGGYLCRPIEYGAAVVVESATKWLGGHGTSMGGVIVEGGTYDWNNGKYPMLSEPSESYHGLRFTETFGQLAFIAKCRAEGVRDLGCCISPFNSFMIMQGIETLSLRVQREADNALALARYFKAHPLVEQVFYPGLEDDPHHELAARYLRHGFGCVLSVVLKGDKRQTESLVDHLRLVSHLANVGDNRTLIIQPAATTHSQLSEEEQRAAGVLPTLLRISARYRAYRRPDSRFRASLFLRESLTDGNAGTLLQIRQAFRARERGAAPRAADRLSYLRQVQGKQCDLGLPRADGQFGRGRLVAADRRAGALSRSASVLCRMRERHRVALRLDGAAELESGDRKALLRVVPVHHRARYGERASAVGRPFGGRVGPGRDRQLDRRGFRRSRWRSRGPVSPSASL